MPEIIAANIGSVSYIDYTTLMKAAIHNMSQLNARVENMERLNTRTEGTLKALLFEIPWGCAILIPVNLLNEIDSIKLVKVDTYPNTGLRFHSEKRVIKLIDAHEVMPAKPSAEFLEGLKKERKAKLEADLKALEEE